MTGRRILVLGATGGTGREIVSQAVQQGHEVTALIRRPEQATGLPERLRVLQGDVTHDTEALAEAVVARTSSSARWASGRL
jgi:putative NADH-flavin reductase